MSYMKSLISVLIPCFNHERFLGDCLESLILQTYENIEILIVDDASKDDSWQIIESYKERLKERFVNVYVKKNEHNRGISPNLNEMLRIAKGDIIKILASDDFLDPNYFEVLYNIIEDKKIDLVFSNAYLVEEQSCLNNPIIKDIYYDSNPLCEKKVRLFERIFKGNIICAPSVMLKKNIFTKYGIFDEELIAEDLDYWLNITKNDSVEFYYCDRPLVYYRQNSNSMTSRKNNKKYEERVIRMFENSMLTRKKYKKYLSGFKYNILMSRILLLNYRVSLKENMQSLRIQCVKYKKFIDQPYRVMLFWVK